MVVGDEAVDADGAAGAEQLDALRDEAAGDDGVQ